MKIANKVLLLLIVSAGVLCAGEAYCRGCDTAKLKLQCDYDVEIKGDLSKLEICEKYAVAVDVDGSHAKAAWYYLLGGKPQKAIIASLKAIDEGQTYAAEYAAEASVIFDEFKEAGDYMQMLRKNGGDKRRFKKNIKLLRKIYPDTDFDYLLRSR